MSRLIKDFELYLDKYLEKISAPTLAEISKIHENSYTCECIALNKEGERTNTVFPNVEIPRFWGTQNGGIFMPPSVGSTIVIHFLDHDISYPIMTSIIGSDHIESFKENEFKIHSENGQINLGTELSITHSNGSNISLNEKITMKNHSSDLRSILLAFYDNLKNISIITPQGTGFLDPLMMGSIIKEEEKIKSLLD